MDTRRWEYRVEERALEWFMTAEALTPIGQDGWELVAVVQGLDGQCVAFFKRPDESSANHPISSDGF